MGDFLKLGYEFVQHKYILSYKTCTICIQKNETTSAIILYYNEHKIFDCIVSLDYILKYYKEIDIMLRHFINKRENLIRFLENNKFYPTNNAKEFFQKEINVRGIKCTIMISIYTRIKLKMYDYLFIDNAFTSFRIYMTFNQVVFWYVQHNFCISYEELLSMDFTLMFNKYIERNILLNGL